LLADEEISQEDAKTQRKKKTSQDDEGFGGERKPVKELKGLETPEDVLKLVRNMCLHSNSSSKTRILLKKILKTENAGLLRKFIASHGITVLKHCFSRHKMSQKLDILLLVDLCIFDSRFFKLLECCLLHLKIR
jgi:hypothetical protein